jgi:hypothetical protein
LKRLVAEIDNPIRGKLQELSKGLFVFRRIEPAVHKQAPFAEIPPTPKATDESITFRQAVSIYHLSAHHAEITSVKWDIEDRKPFKDAIVGGTA